MRPLETVEDVYDDASREEGEQPLQEREGHEHEEREEDHRLEALHESGRHRHCGELAGVLRAQVALLEDGGELEE